MYTKRIPAKLYRRIQRILPIACVDVLVKTKSGEVLLGIRKNEVLKGYVFPIGGRIHYGESLEDAVRRKVRVEAGLRVRVVKQIGVYTTLYTKGERRYNVVIAYLAKETGGKAHLPKGSDLSGFVRVKRIEKNMHPYLRQILSDSSVFGKRIKARRKSFVN